ncbi:MAG: MlaE family lipid ABC transporter permease subunit [Thiotrichales bacterium]|nr:MlaE family lipid ABC transporter permease subunit [Thiotrichales bacterium]
MTPAERICALGRMGIFLAQGITAMLTPPYKTRALVKQIHFIGVRSMSVIVLSGLFVGMVVALLFQDTLVRFGATSMAGSAVGLSLIWELGPVLTALMVIGRAGSAICAEISIMRSEQQIDALECMAIDPIRHIVVPRISAALISIPLLTAVFIVIGIMGGYFISVILFGLSPGAYFQGMFDTVLMRDLHMCAIKTLTFSLLIIWITTSKGYFLHLVKGAYGSEGVSHVTTTAVVHSSIAVLCADYLVSAIML